MKTEMTNNDPAAGVTADFNKDASATARHETHTHFRQPHYSHDLPEASTDAFSRVIVRIVPLIFGTLLGSLAGNLAVGITAASAIALAFDLSMEDQSVVRGVWRRLRKQS
ncbi:MAG: hypothetical protein KDI82_01345 [Gammaproteobacteria bacterium]|nr:hypothetical protein [Gammaproteobacteria bacterium]